MRIGLAILAAAMVISGNHARAHEYTAGNLFIQHPAVNATPPGAKVAAGYFTVKNNGDTDDVLLGIDAPGLAKRAEIHSMALDGGIMKMRKVDTLTIPAHGEAVLSPSGNHIMFMDISGAVKEDDRIEATLRFKNAGDVKVTFDGEPTGSGSAPHAHH